MRSKKLRCVIMFEGERGGGRGGRVGRVGGRGDGRQNESLSVALSKIFTTNITMYGRQ